VRHSANKAFPFRPVSPELVSREKEGKMSKTKFDVSIILGFKGLNVFRRFNTVSINSYEGLKNVRSCLQNGRSVRVAFDGSLEAVKARYINYLHGMSCYFGAELVSA
jgi:hypothetical protein